MRSSLLPMHEWKLRQEASQAGRGWAMKRQWRFRAVESAALVFAYFWYNANVHAVLTRVLF
jgi:hypothetical protein